MKTEIDARDIRRGHHFTTNGVNYFATADADTTYYYGWVKVCVYNASKDLVEDELFQTDQQYFLIDEETFEVKTSRYHLIRDKARDYFEEEPSNSLLSIWNIFIMNTFNRN